MNNNNSDLLVESVNILQNCKNTLTELSKTCCMPERSPNMNEAQLLFDDLILKTKAITQDTQNAHQCINDIGTIGSKMGYLYASCCTATREPLYQSIFKSLMTVHSRYWNMLGHSH